MIFKRIIALCLCACLIFGTSGCAKNSGADNISADTGGEDLKHSKLIPFIISAALLTGCNFGGNESMRKYPDNEYKELPQEYMSACENGGKVEKFVYTTRDNLDFSGNAKEFEKYALVYLPEGYDENDTETRYNVLYLMHGGSDSPEWYFGGEGQSTQLKNIIDHLIANGECEPTIVCAVSYYTEYSNDATKNCKNFYIELTKDIIPVFETKYHTYAEDVTPEELKNSRRHRAFGGFSMGAVTTWATFENELDIIAYYMPISGDCWAKGMSQGEANAEYLDEKVKESGWGPEDFYIYSGTGSNDIAEPNLTPQIEAMKKLDSFKWCKNFKNGNLYEAVYEGGYHDVNTVVRIIYNGLPKMFG